MIFRERRLSCLQPPAEVALATPSIRTRREQTLPFATSGGSGFGNTVSELQPSAPGAQIVEGKILNRMTKQDINNWVKGL